MRGAGSEASDPLLTIAHLTMRFGGLTAVDDLSFDVRRGDITALIGPNGAGKTTVFNCITGFYRPRAGRLGLATNAGTPGEAMLGLMNSSRRYSKRHGVFLLERMPDQEIAREARVARTFQNIRLFTGMTVLENLMVGEHNALMQASFYSLFGLLGLPFYRRREAAALDHARDWLERIGLTARADDPAGALPYGAQRRLEIARAMMGEPVLLCLDEPAAGLNLRESAELNELLQTIRGERGTSILLIEHDMSVVMQISDHIVVLDYGRKIADGTPDSIRNDARVIAAYLGVADEEEVVDIEAGLAAGKAR
jgi:branched-chain amino acid transport system ATP-binding protein